MFVLNSKHLHIFLAPLNVLFGRDPKALGAAKPMMNEGKALTLDDFEDLDEDSKLGVGAAEDFSWKGILDFATCTECGRCQDQCPAWNTEKPLSPKLMIMALRDHTLAKAPYLLADEGKREGKLEGNEKLAREVERPLVGDTGDDWFYMPDSGAGVIDPDVLWSCVTCGACVEQCPVDIEHVDHIVDMRRYQVLVESNFPSELNGLFKGLENKGNPWNMSATARMDWAKDLPFDVKVVGEDVESLDEVEWLFWVGCAGAYEDRAKKTTRAVAELLDMAGVDFAVLGNGETCNGDSARRAGNEFVFQGLAQQNIETFKEYKVKKVVSTCAHCFNTLKNEYRGLGYKMEVVHHTQLLNRLVREKKLTPVRTPERSWKGPHQRPITYHDPCYIGRHNQVYEAPRELLNVIPDTRLVEMPRNSERSFCCGAGGARMWMEETIGSRINETRTAEAVATGADQIAVGCPFCRVMLSDGLTSQQANGEAREEVEVLDVAQLLLAAVKGESKPASKTAAKSGGSAEAKSGDGGSGGGTAVLTKEADSKAGSEATKAEPEAGDATQTDETVTETEDVGAAAKASSGGGSLFDIGGDSEDSTDDSVGEEVPANADDRAPSAPAEEPPGEPEDKSADKSGDEGFGGGSLFDLGGDDSCRERGTRGRAEGRGDRRRGGPQRGRRRRGRHPRGRDRGRHQARTGVAVSVRGEVRGSTRSRWRDLHTRHRDPRGRLPVRHRRTRGVRTGREARARCRAGHRRGRGRRLHDGRGCRPQRGRRRRGRHPRGRERSCHEDAESGLEVRGSTRSRWRDLHTRHRDPRGRLPVRHRRTRGVRTGREVRSRCRAGHRRGRDRRHADASPRTRSAKTPQATPRRTRMSRPDGETSPTTLRRARDVAARHQGEVRRRGRLDQTTPPRRPRTRPTPRRTPTGQRRTPSPMTIQRTPSRRTRSRSQPHRARRTSHGRTPRSARAVRCSTSERRPRGHCGWT